MNLSGNVTSSYGDLHSESPSPSAEDTEEFAGAECINGICFASNFFTAEQRRLVNSLIDSVISNSEFYRKKEIKLLRAKHRKAIKKLKSGIAHLELKLELCESLSGGIK